MSDHLAVTALIPAYNAATTIARAIDSVRDQVDRVLVFDDGSDDNTAAVVRSFPREGLTLLQADSNRGIGHARQQLLRACETPLAVWLDADDECLPGRVQRLAAIIDTGADWVFDAALLVDGASGATVRELPIPEPLLAPDGEVCEFARNYIPSLGWAMVRTDAARAVDYDPAFRQAEDYDHLLRAVLAKKIIRFCEQPGYRYCDYPTSVSRDLAEQTRWAERALGQLDREQVQQRILLSRLPRRDQDRVLAFFLARVRAWDDLWQLTRTAAGDWELAFLHGVACYHALQLPAAIKAFDQSLALEDTAAAWNNRGVCRLRAGDEAGRADIEHALQLMPHYLDAQANCAGGELVLTRFPLRRQPIRDRY